MKKLKLSVLFLFTMSLAINMAFSQKEMKKMVKEPKIEGIFNFEKDFSFSKEAFLDEGFEGDFPPTNWTLSPGTGDDWAQDAGTEHGPGAPYSGSYCAFFNDYDYALDATASMITPALDFSAATAPRLYFAYWDGSGSDVVEVKVSTDGTNYTTVYTTESDVDVWTVLVVDLASYAGESTVYVEFAGTSVYGFTNPHIDNVLIEEGPTEAILSINYSSVDFGEIPVGIDYNPFGDVFEISNTGGALLTVTTVTDLSGTEFSTNFVAGDVSVPYGDSVYAFGFTYSPVDEDADTVEFIIETNGGTDTIMLTGQAYVIPDDVVEVGYESWTGTSLPMEPFFRYSYSQSIYLQSELNVTGKRISKLLYHYNGNSAWTEEISVYMKHTDQTELGDYLPWDGFTKVFEGEMTVPNEDGWVEITLTMPFNYNNTDNLVVTFFTHTYAYYSSGDEFFASRSIFGADTLYMSVQDYRDTEEFDPTDDTLEPDSLYFRPNTRFVFEDLPTGPAIALTTSSHDFGLIEAEFTDSLSVMVYNTGIAELNITSVTVAAPFYCDYTGNIAVGQSDEVVIHYMPMAEGDYEEVLKFVSNSTAGADSVILMGSAYAKGSLYESFEDVVFPPEFWMQTGSGFQRGTYASSAYHGSCYTYLSSGIDTLITPELTVEAGDVLSFAAKNSSYSGGSLYIAYSTDLVAWDSLTAIDITSDYQMFEVDLSSLASKGRAFIGFVGDAYVYLDMVMGPVMYFPDNDLAAIDIAGPGTPTQADEVIYSVTIKNMGLLEQSDYTVKLKLADGTEIGSIAGETIGFYNEITYDFAYTFSTVIETGVYGEIVFTADENADNDVTETLPVNVQPLGSVSVTIGEGVDLSYYAPANFFYKSSLSQSLYYPGEIGIAGTLNNITYYNSFATDLNDSPIKIWVGETDLMDLTEAFIPATDLTLVFDGALDFPIGENDILVNFIEGYDYQGGNLVIMVERPLDTAYYSSSDKFYGNDDTPYDDRTRYYQSDYTPNDPENPVGGSTIDFVPMTKFIFDVSGRGHLEGMVYDENSDSLPGVEVMIEGTNFKAKTDSMGYYSIGYIPEGTHDVTAAFFGYNDNTQSATIAEFVTTTLDFNMVLRPQVTVSGNVEKSDVPGTGLENAYVVVMGYADYADSTDANGDFTFADVWGNTTYTIIITAEGCEPYEGEFDVVNAAVDLGTIVLDEIPFPPIGVMAEMLDTDALVTWNEPGTLIPAEFRYDDGMVTGQLGFGSNPAAVLGGAHFYNAVIEEVTWLLTSNAAHTEAVIYIFGLDEFGWPDVNLLLHESEVQPNIDDTWNTYVLPEPVEAPNGFLVGVCTPDIFTAIGTDDGVDEPYVFELGTQFGISDWTDPAVDWSDIGTVGFPYNFTIRAYGYDMGEISYAKYAKRASVATDQIVGSKINPFNPGEPQLALSHDYANKAFESYNVYRLLEGFEDSVETWISLATGLTDTSYTDATVSAQDDGMYKYAVEAVYTNAVVSQASFSNALAVGMDAQVTINITTNAGDAEGAVVLLVNQDGLEEHAYDAVAPAGGVVVFDAVWKGMYDLSITMTGYVPYEGVDIEITDDVEEIDVELVEIIIAPYNLDVEVNENTAIFSWNNSGSELLDDFESYDDFVMEFSPWTLVDLDQSTTYGFSGIDFPNSGSAMAYIIFNPGTTTPPMTDTEAIQPYSGDKFAACFASTAPPNNDWLMTEAYTVSNGDVVSFMAKTYIPDYGLERFLVGVSTTGTAPGNFTIISAGDYLEAPSEAWTEYEYDLSAYAGNIVHVGIQCVSNDAFIFMVDDVYLGPAIDKGKVFVEYNVYLDDMTTPVTSTTEVSYTFTGLQYLTEFEAGVSSVYTSEESEIIKIDFETPVGVNEIAPDNYFTVYPNPAKDKLNVSSLYSIDKVEMFNTVGKLVVTNENYVNGIDVSELTDGIYIVHITSGDNVITKRVSITK